MHKRYIFTTYQKITEPIKTATVADAPGQIVLINGRYIVRAKKITWRGERLAAMFSTNDEWNAEIMLDHWRKWDSNKKRYVRKEITK